MILNKGGLRTRGTLTKQTWRLASRMSGRLPKRFRRGESNEPGVSVSSAPVSPSFQMMGISG